ncbi:WhiB family transcriptional regulator [Mycobacterium sp. URHB0044]|uniref:WhiB family transcriptional regulator n=1 Tax=Mycobacterium sp. URHB0044 TaxID=1380386 RepID=UPI00048C1040|nr:WhiB family transcriptional regulator [Mycobacterium sp. URHB0044]
MTVEVFRTAESWQERGSCRRLAPEVFYPEDGGRTGLQAREEHAKRICGSCPVVADCRNHALSARETYGVWGAMSARDRQREFAARREPVLER